MEQTRTIARRAGLLGLLGALVAAEGVAGQASVAVEGLYGWADGPVATEVLGAGARVGLPLGVSLTGEVSRWEAAPGADCADSEPESIKCDVGGWMGLAGLRVGIPIVWPVQPYVGAMIGRSFGDWTPGFEDDPSSWSVEGGIRAGLGPLEGSAGVRYLSVSDLGYEAVFDESPGYLAFLLRVGFAF